jgi:NMD protein affecting ribosome stability and mRNA decay
MSQKSRIRAGNRAGVRSYKGSPGIGKVRKRPGAAVCHRCGAIFAGKTWRRDHKVSLEFYDRARWVLCDACTQAGRSEGFGRILLRGDGVEANEDAIRRRMENVASRAAFTQPERRISAIGPVRGGLEVVTTSQKLAHRITRELIKAFGGEATYRWSDRDGSLLATWTARATAPEKTTRRPRRKSR